MPHVSASWLRDHLSLPEDISGEEIAAALVKVGIEEEEIIPAAVTGPLVAGKVLSFVDEDHSNGKVVRYCRVDVGPYNDAPGTGAEPSKLPSRGIICGADNFAVGDTVTTVLPGAILPGPFPISARKTYGHISDGMICSERELRLGDDHDGIMVLDRIFPADELPEPGTDLIPLLGLGEEVVEVNVTPDRGYCFAVRGLARELALSTGYDYVDLGLPEAISQGIPGGGDSDDDVFLVEVDPESVLEGRAASDRFVTRVVRGIDPQAETPQWMVTRLEQAGMRPLSLPVDVTNYVMLDLGQPLHAYDLDFAEAPFVVRRAEPEEAFQALDGTELVLSEQDILITDSPDGKRGSRVVGLAGVMGGLNSEVQPDTTDVVIEAAHFDPVSVARTARRHRLHSESSKRFERGVDPALAPVAAARAAELIAEYGGGTIDPVQFDYNEVPSPSPIPMNVGEVARIAGLDLSTDQITDILVSIGCDVSVEGNNLLITPPSWRPDLVGPAHFVEEVARLYGYDQIGSRVPSAPGSAGLSAGQRLRRHTSTVLASSGLVEVLSYPFVGETHDKQLLPQGDARRNTVKLSNPLTGDTTGLRTTILDGLLQTAERNAARGVTPLALFEMGQVATVPTVVTAEIPGVSERPSDEELSALFAGVPNQPWRVAGVMGGPLAPRSGAQMEAGAAGLGPWDWSDALEAARMVCNAAGVNLEAARTWNPAVDVSGKRFGPPVPPLVAEPEQTAPWHPSRCATLFVRQGRKMVVLGRAGELHPKVVENFGLPARSVAFELDLKALESVLPQGFLKSKRVSVFPPAKEDFAFVVADSVPEEDVAMTIKRAARDVLESVTLFDIYRGDQVPEGHRSVAYALTLRAPDRTLSAADVEQVRQKVITEVEKRLGAKLRA